MTHAGARTDSALPPEHPHGRHIVAFRRRRVIQIVMLVALILVIVGGVIVVGELSSRPAAVTPPAGAAPLGSISYPAPKDALFVSPKGSDQASGTKAAPLRSVQQAITLAGSGQTIVLRAGSYHQRVTVAGGKAVTIQPYLKEVVWFDGSAVVSNWRQDGGVWISDGWTTQFDSSPTFERGAPDNTEPGWIFLNPQYPLAAHPDQLWIDGKEQNQVAAVADVVPGTFAVDVVTSRLYLGSDPTGREVRSSDKTKAVSIQSANSILRGVGIRRYGTSVPGFGAVTVEAPGVVVDNLLIEQNATTGLFVGAARATVRHVTVRDNGMMGMGANYADDLQVTGLLATGNNTQHFNNAPVSGGFKLTRSRTVTIENSRFNDNFGPGLWFDQSDFDANVVANDISGNHGHGLILEISARFVVAGNTISHNRDNGIKLNDTSKVQIWNNTITANGIDLRIVQDLRRASDPSIPGHDPRQRQPDPNMTWVISAIAVSNNVFSGATGDSVVSVEDYSGEYTAEQLGVALDGNAYQRQGASSPKQLIKWSRGKGDPNYATLAAFTRATKQEKNGAELGFASAVKATWLHNGPDSSPAAGSVRPVPPSIRKLLGWDDSVHRLGAH
jgi:parallel beta-helix repeat protein